MGPYEVWEWVPRVNRDTLTELLLGPRHGGWNLGHILSGLWNSPAKLEVSSPYYR